MNIIALIKNSTLFLVFRFTVNYQNNKCSLIFCGLVPYKETIFSQFPQKKMFLA